MGDRANIFIVDQKNEGTGVAGIYLYTHWSGSEWPEELRVALHYAKPRWTDPSYCTRIVISHVYSDIHQEETGGGVSTMLTDNEHPIIVCDMVTQTVSFAAEGQETNPLHWRDSLSFEDYVAQSVAEYPDLPIGAI